MIVFNFSSKINIVAAYPKEYPELLEFEGDFTIKVNDELLFAEPHFSILEFLLFVDNWLTDEDKSNDMFYNSVDTDENPLISFNNKDGKWIITSPWQFFKCNTFFSRDELEKAIILLKKSIGY